MSSGTLNYANLILSCLKLGFALHSHSLCDKKIVTTQRSGKGL